MAFFTKLFFESDKPDKKLFFCQSSAINYLTLSRVQGKDCTHLHLAVPIPDISYKVEGDPETVNKIAFENKFYRSTLQFIRSDQTVQHFTAWINLDNIASIHEEIKDSSFIWFKNGHNVVLSQTAFQFVSKAITFQTEYRKVQKEKYGKK
jgi:hypothetical protein